ncbi:MAG: hypothetical protein ACXWWX_08235, partial [Actinomycetota bacterium]
MTGATPREPRRRLGGRAGFAVLMATATFAGCSLVQGAPAATPTAPGLATASRVAETCGGEAVTIAGTPDSEYVQGTDGPDVIAAGDGDDVVYGLDGA